MNRDDYLRPLRALLRELARVLRSELKLQEFARGLMGRTEPLPRDVDNARAFVSTIDLIALCLFLAVMPNARSEKKDIAQVKYFTIKNFSYSFGFPLCNQKKILLVFLNTFVLY